MWARKLPALDSMHMSSLWLFSTHHPHLHGQKNLKKKTYASFRKEYLIAFTYDTIH